MAILTVQQRKAGAIVIPASFSLVDTLSLAEAQTVTSSGVSPFFTEDWSTYTSTANLRTNPNGWYTAKLDGSSDGNETFNAAQISLDQTDGYGALTQCMLYSYPTANVSDYTIGCNINLPITQTHLWVELAAKFSSNWTDAGPAAGAQDFKWFFGNVNGDTGRYEIHIGSNSSTDIGAGLPDPSGYENFGFANSHTNMASTSFDGAWHVYRWYIEVTGDGTGKYRLQRDGVTLFNLSALNIGATTNIYKLALGRNLNKGTSAPQTLKWGRILCYSSDPGWVF